MAIMLYRKGNTHTCKDILCEVGRFEEYSVAAALKDGWHASIESIDSPENDTLDITPVVEKTEKRPRTKRGL
jgi:hypothetical protein